MSQLIELTQALARFIEEMRQSQIAVQTQKPQAWLGNLDRQRPEIMPIMEGVYGAADADRWL